MQSSVLLAGRKELTVWEGEKTCEKLRPSQMRGVRGYRGMSRGAGRASSISRCGQAGAGCEAYAIFGVSLRKRMCNEEY